jgi:peroxiredoxin
MNSVITPAALALAAALSMTSAGPVSTPSSPGMRPGGFEPVGTGSGYALVQVGSQAPDFSFELVGRMQRLHDLRGKGHVLLVIAPDDARLAALERERPRLEALGVTPVAVLDQRAGACAATARRLGLGYTILPDPRRVIGAQFNTLDPQSLADAPAWFVIDKGGRVRDLARLAWPERPWAEIATRALGLPDPDPAVPVSLGHY